MAKVYKVRDEEVEAIKEALMKFVIDKKVLMKEADVIHALIKYHLKNLKSEEVVRYREDVLGKDD